MRDHTSDGKIPCIVPGCKESFQDGYLLRNHMRVHEGKKPLQIHSDKKFQCEECQGSYSTNQNLRRHMKRCNGKMRSSESKKEESKTPVIITSPCKVIPEMKSAPLSIIPPTMIPASFLFAFRQNLPPGSGMPSPFFFPIFRMPFMIPPQQVPVNAQG